MSCTIANLLTCNELETWHEGCSMRSRDRGATSHLARRLLYEVARAGRKPRHISRGGNVAHAIGCIGSSQDGRTKTRPAMTKEQRKRNTSLVPRKVRNQTRAIGFILVSRDGEKPKVRAIRAGHGRHYQQALMFAEVEIMKDSEGKPLTVKRPK